MSRLLWIALAGAAGTLARYGLQGLVQSWSGSAFPSGTLVVNALGCFLFGALWALAEERMTIGPDTRVVCLVGFLGAFTTFSSFAFETGQLLREAQWLLTAANLLAQNGLGLLCLFLGAAAARALA
ncbi:MAG: fluoride efflux transporter CrcB [Planctomycetota bacterium]|nr:MAG: fluoride efflux transporter CrcB [Planctomycetota bacterium]